MPFYRSFNNFSLIHLLLFVVLILPAFRGHYAPPPSNDDCSSATVIDISGGGYDYGTYTSVEAELSTATGETGEHFQFAPGHTKSIWFTFTLPTRRSTKIEITATSGVIPNPTDAGVTVYQSATCLPGSGSKLGAFISSGDLSNPCLDPGKYLVQVSGVGSLDATVFVKITLGCPDHPTESLFDCPSEAYFFNGGAPLPDNTVSQSHNIQCHSIEDPSEFACLPFADRSEYSSSSWYVFTTGNVIDYLDFYFFLGDASDKVGYRLFEGNVITTPLSSLTQIDCGAAKERLTTRFIEFPCMLQPLTTYTLSLLFHEDFVFNNMRITARQRGVSATGWPRPVLPPVVASNQLGGLPYSPAPGTQTIWADRFDCESFISNNVCAPANPAAGSVNVGGKRYDLSTWATFSLAQDVNVEFVFTALNGSSSYHTRIFNKTLTGSCPSPNPSSGDLFYQFSGSSGLYNCMPAGEYSIQVLSSSVTTNTSPPFHEDGWSYGSLGTTFELSFFVSTLPVNGLFRLDAPGEYEAINNLNPLLNGFSYPGTPATFTCRNTVLPLAINCLDEEKAIYREVNIGDANGDGTPDSGLLSIGILRTDAEADPPIHYSLYKGDANQLATAAGTHDEGEFIPGLQDHAGICIEQDDNTLFPEGIEDFCACVTPDIYTFTSYGDDAHVGKTDSVGFRFNIYKTIHDSRANAEFIFLGPAPDTFSSNADVFSCIDNIGSMPGCNDNFKLVFREFFLAEPTVVTIAEYGSADNVLSLFTGRASDLSATLTLVASCFQVQTFTDNCTPLEPGWYTLVSYGDGPNYTDRKIYDEVGSREDVGLTTIVSIALTPPTIPNFNLPEKAHQAGITDWATPPAAFPNAITRRIYPFPRDTFCDPDTPFIPESLLPCAPGYNRISMYVFEITKPSFVQIRGLNQSFYTEVYPFDVNATPDALLTTPPVYQCLSENNFFRQICDLQPGKYTICIFANDDHKGQWIAPLIYVDAAAPSRFDHAWNAYDFDVIPTTNSYVNGKLFDVHPTIPGQAPSRDVFYCTTGATTIDPSETQCFTSINPLIYAQPDGVPKPLFLQNNPPLPRSQPWRNLWYTFMLTGSGICSLQTEVLGGTVEPPLIAVYESSVNADIPWSSLQTMLMNPGNSIIPGLRLVAEHIDIWCDAEEDELIFTKSGCVRDSVRYYVVMSFDVFKGNQPPNLPNQTVSLSIKYDPRPTFAYPYDERRTANVVNGSVETAPPYSSNPLSPGESFISTDFSLLCYTKNVTDPPGCGPPETGKSAWFKFEVDATGHFYVALEELAPPNGWLANTQDMTIWRETGENDPLTDNIPLKVSTYKGHDWLSGCINPGTYYLLVRQCDTIDTIQPYRVVMELSDSPGDFCINAIPVNVVDATPSTATAIIDCHTIGTDIGEFLPAGNTCFQIPFRKTSWFHAVVNAGPMVDLNFEFEDDFQSSTIGLNDLSYRILAGNCGAMTPIVCSSVGTNVITLNCLGPGDYYIQVSMPQKVDDAPGSADLEGTLTLIVTATPSNPVTCTEPIDPNAVIADFTFVTDCEMVSFFNLSTAGTDISYLWQFPDSTSTVANPVWMPNGAGTYMIRLITTNVVSNVSDTVLIPVTVTEPFAAYTELRDTVICNNAGNVILDATLTGATYEWDNGSVNPTRVVTTSGTYSVIIRKDGCEKFDTALVGSIDASRSIFEVICPESNYIVNGEIFDINNPTGTVVLPNADPSGCDSLLFVELEFHPAPITFLNVKICEGEFYFFDNQNLTAQGSYTDTLTSTLGCDSLITLNLEVTAKQLIAHDDSTCIGMSLELNPSVTGEKYTWDDNSTGSTRVVTDAGTYQVTVTDEDGCVISEETFEAAFEILASPAFAFPQSVCPGADVPVTASGPGTYTWYDALTGGNVLGNGPVLVLSNVMVDTTVYVEASLTGPSGTCVSERVPVEVIVTEETAVTKELDTLVCAGSSVVLPWGEDVLPGTNTSYMHTWLSTVTGCDSLHMTVHVNVLDLPPLSLPEILKLHLGDSVLLMPHVDFIADSSLWSPEEGLACPRCTNTWAYPLTTTDYEVQIWSPEGCWVTATVRIEVSNEIRIYIPNVFTPNEDGSNDRFTVYAKKEVGLVRKLTIYDRWGEAVWQDQNFTPGTRGWDGIAWGKPMQSGVYVWVCEIQLIDGSVEVLAGDVTLIR